jgi:putative phosphoesterase
VRIAALYDIHGNLPALDAVLRDLEEAEPDLVVVGGDAVPGPLPREVVSRLTALGDRVRPIRGNGERETLAAGDDESRWVRERLTETQRTALAGWPATWTVRLGDRTVLFCHATPGDDTTILTPLSPDPRLRRLVAPAGADVVVCGHTHVQFEHRVDAITILNAGSVGMPYEDGPGAYWLLLDDGGREFRRTPYDVAAALESMEGLGYPGAWFIESLRRQPGREEALAEFERRAREGG